MKYLQALFAALIISFASLSPAVAQQSPEGHVDDTLEIMESFNQQAISEAEEFELTDKEKHKILFFMGVALLVLLCTTAYMGVSMVVFNKEVFVPHMICAGLTVTLGLAHAVAAVVWFFPF